MWARKRHMHFTFQFRTKKKRIEYNPILEKKSNDNKELCGAKTKGGGSCNKFKDSCTHHNKISRDSTVLKKVRRNQKQTEINLADESSDDQDENSITEPVKKTSSKRNEREQKNKDINIPIEPKSKKSSSKREERQIESSEGKNQPSVTEEEKIWDLFKIPTSEREKNFLEHLQFIDQYANLGTQVWHILHTYNEEHLNTFFDDFTESISTNLPKSLKISIKHLHFIINKQKKISSESPSMIDFSTSSTSSDTRDPLLQKQKTTLKTNEAIQNTEDTKKLESFEILEKIGPEKLLAL